MEFRSRQNNWISETRDSLTILLPANEKKNHQSVSARLTANKTAEWSPVLPDMALWLFFHFHVNMSSCPQFPRYHFQKYFWQHWWDDLHDGTEPPLVDVDVRKAFAARSTAATFDSTALVRPTVWKSQKFPVMIFRQNFVKWTFLLTKLISRNIFQ